MNNPNARKLMFLFAAIYIAEGLGQMGGLINQPLTLFLLKEYNWNSTQIATFLSVLSFPWLIKPLYGIISDFVPLFGYRRKIYLILANALAVGGYLFIAGMTQPSQIAIALLLTAFGMAISSTLCGAVLVENGKKSGLNGTFVSQQWLWFWIANICASFIGGQLCERFAPGYALHVSATIAAVSLVGVMFACWFFTEEERTTVNVEAMKASFRSLWSSLTSKTLWIVGAFIFAYYFSPGFGTPLFVHMTRDLHFSQEFIGNLNSIGAFGHIVGALIFRMLTKRVAFKRLVLYSILLGAFAQAGFVFLAGPLTAIALNFIAGACGMIAVLAVLTLAADACPDGAEGFTYALLMSLHNAATPVSQWVGAYLYDHTFQQNLTPLILVSAGLTALSLVMLPILKLGNNTKKKDE